MSCKLIFYQLGVSCLNDRDKYSHISGAVYDGWMWLMQPFFIMYLLLRDIDESLTVKHGMDCTSSSTLSFTVSLSSCTYYISHLGKCDCINTADARVHTHTHKCRLRLNKAHFRLIKNPLKTLTLVKFIMLKWFLGEIVFYFGLWPPSSSWLTNPEQLLWIKGLIKIWMNTWS